MSEHAPGPWKIQRYKNYIGFAIYADGHGCVAERWEDISDERRQEARLANARLIAAAPTMLAALKLFETQASVCVVGVRDQCYAAARAAIAEAEGETDE